MRPVVNRLHEEYRGRVVFRAVNVDLPANAEIMTRYNFVGTPQVVVVGADGAVAETFAGIQRYEFLKAGIESALAAAN
jgi:thioredoxin-like negative regulator of GroEL